jgi:hypothetical protein
MGEHPTSQVISIRLPDEAASRLRQLARRGGRSLNELGALSIQEWLRQNEFSDIEFRSFSGPFGAERHACLKGSLPLWQVIQIARGFGMDAGRTAAYFGYPAYRVQAAFHYYEAYPQEIDEAIEDNTAQNYETLKRLLPQLTLAEVNLESEVSPANSLARDILLNPVAGDKPQEPDEDTQEAANPQEAREHEAKHQEA